MVGTKIALKCFNRLYTKSNVLKDCFTWIYVFPNEINPHYYEHYLTNCKNPTDLTNCVHLNTFEMKQDEIEKWNRILIYTKNIGAYYSEYPTAHSNFIQKQYTIRDYSIKLE